MSKLSDKELTRLTFFSHALASKPSGWKQLTEAYLEHTNEDTSSDYLSLMGVLVAEFSGGNLKNFGQLVDITEILKGSGDDMKRRAGMLLQWGVESRQSARPKKCTKCNGTGREHT